jgi:hypothetical protein
VFAVILGNPAMIEAYQAGIPGNGKHFPDGAKMAKIHWKAKTSEEAPAPTKVAGALHDIDFMVKDNARFADSGGWGYGAFKYDAAADTFTPATKSRPAAARARRQVRLRVPYDRAGERLRVHGVPEAVSGGADRRPPDPKRSWGKRAGTPFCAREALDMAR